MNNFLLIIISTKVTVGPSRAAVDEPRAVWKMTGKRAKFSSQTENIFICYNLSRLDRKLLSLNRYEFNHFSNSTDWHAEIFYNILHVHAYV